MKKPIINAIEEYQCPGCVGGSDISCYVKGEDLACSKHVAGTMVSFVGRFFLGMPKGFNRIGPVEDMHINIFETVADGWGFDNLNVPIWKHLDGNGNTLVRGLCPRINKPFLHVYLATTWQRLTVLI
jgi:hypothetical protein